MKISFTIKKRIRRANMESTDTNFIIAVNQAYYMGSYLLLDDLLKFRGF